MSLGETACSYALLILEDDNIPATADNITTLLKSAKVDVESFWPALFAKLAEKKNIRDLIASAAGGGAAVAAAPVAASGGGAAAAPAAAAEKKPEPEEEESDEEMGFGLFDE
jgi:large subunit ribosomal protein LP1